jgi:hypothetical protein
MPCYNGSHDPQSTTREGGRLGGPGPRAGAAAGTLFKARVDMANTRPPRRRPTRTTRFFDALLERLWYIGILSPLALFGVAAIVVPGWWKVVACAAVPGWLVLLFYVASRADEKMDTLFDDWEREERERRAAATPGSDPRNRRAPRSP